MELKEIQNYLAYGVKYIFHTSYNGGTNKLETIVGLGDSFVTYRDSSSKCVDICLSESKLILRPLSDLTKPCLEGGKIPIEELKEIAGYPEKFRFNGTDFVFEFEGDLSYDGGYEFEKTTQCCSNQLELFSWLFEHHFDVFGLISKGEAIDINTISKWQTTTI